MLENSEEVDSTNLFLKLRTVKENDVFTVFGKFKKRFSDIGTTQVGDHGWTQKQYCVLIKVVRFSCLFLDCVSVILDDSVDPSFFFLVQNNDIIVSLIIHFTFFQEMLNVAFPLIGEQHNVELIN